MKNKSVLLTIAILTIAMGLAAQEIGTFTDSRDGKKYKTVKIGTQTWMAENLAYKATSGCRVYDNNENNVAIYGYLYDGATAKKVCPVGWHLPTDVEWKTLIDYLGGESIAGGKMKEKGTSHWTSPNSGATNSSGFSALPGGAHYKISAFQTIGWHGGWWGTANDDEYIKWSLTNAESSVSENNDVEIDGFSVRCIKD